MHLFSLKNPPTPWGPPQNASFYFPKFLVLSQTCKLWLSGGEDEEVGKSPIPPPPLAPFLPMRFLSFRLGKSPSFPGMTRPGWMTLKRVSAVSMGRESRQYWYASWLGMVESNPFEYSTSRKIIRTYNERFSVQILEFADSK